MSFPRILLTTLPRSSLSSLATRSLSSVTTTTIPVPKIIVQIMNPSSDAEEEIEELHRTAVLQNSTTYIEPSTGFTVFTEIAHLKRGTCCGNQCRHCPYGWGNVAAGERRKAKLKSGDKAMAKVLLTEIANLAVDNKTNGKGGRHGGTHTKKNVPYTRSGDKGTSQLLTGEKRPKDDVSFEAMGTVDELCSIVGIVHAQLSTIESTQYGNLPEWLLDIMSRLFDIGSLVAKPKHKDVFSQSHIDDLELWIDTMTEPLPELQNFILPTGCMASAQLHLARTVCRRAERIVVPLVRDELCHGNVMQYLNRLSDFCFVAARFVNYCEGEKEILYRKEKRKDKVRGRVVVNLKEEEDERG